MSCEHLHVSDCCVTICRPRFVERKVEFDAHRWCFKCRERTAHEWVLLDEEGPTYYEAFWVRRCDGCGGDHTEFPRGDLW